MIRFAATEDLKLICPVDQIVDDTLAPTTDMTFALLCSLHDNHIIQVSPNSQLDAFTEDIDRFYPVKVAWLPPVNNHKETQALIYDLEAKLRSVDWPINWIEEAYPFWQELARNECLEYLNLCLQDHGFKFKPGDKTIKVIDMLLEHYCVAQAYALIFSAAKGAAAYYMRGQVSKEQAANSVVVRIQRYLDRSLSEAWDVDHYNRHTPESIVSQVFYKVALKLDGSGIDYVPDKLTIKKQLPNNRKHRDWTVGYYD